MSFIVLIFHVILLGQARLGEAGPFSKRNETLSLPVNQTVYKPAFVPPSNSTPLFRNVTQKNVNPLVGAAGSLSLSKRQSTPGGEGTCAPGTPCSNGACCSSSGLCGYSPDFCGPANCISNCDAKAQCGQYAVPGKEKCPLNVCCSQFGFCGTTEEFCGTGCDTAGGGLCGPPPGPPGRSGGFIRSIGYYESWATTRPCDAVEPGELDLTGLTHLNFAFAFFHPTTFQVTPMDSNAGRLLKTFTSVKTFHPRLQTWISVGGWSFNDPGNNPDTRTAFSNMASTAANRATFIASLMSFMRNYGFDGVDIDWEYPGADDRGGTPADTQNYVLLCKEMKSAFAGKYGLSVTLPASFWYLQHFDLKGMEPHVDWFNVMTYDIHGVWDSSNRFTGPYVRPHSNLTEISEGISLLWRAGISASNVVLGLGFYGRSFTLSSPSCSTPWCTFSEGARPGECTNAVGILSLAEIGRIITENNLQPTHDEQAAVKWITWDSDQWVSYDDQDTFVQKMDWAREMGLSGTMVWAIDQGVYGSTNSRWLGNSAKANSFGLSMKTVETVQDYLDAGESCYVTFCGGECTPGYFSQAQMKGQVGELGAGSACTGGKVQNLCCKTGTFMGHCEWTGWRGQGLSCYGGQCAVGDTLVTVNSNHFFSQPTVRYVEDQTCNGGSQSYCCRGFRPSLQHGKDPKLVQPQDVDNNPQSIAKRDLKTCATLGTVAGGTVVLATGGGVNPLGDLAGLAAGGIVTLYCLLSQNEGAVKKLSGWSGPVTRGQAKIALSIAAGTLPPAIVPAPKAVPKTGTANGVKMYGRYALANYTGKVTCSTTYTCDYGLGFDQVCDNQRWGLDEVTHPINVFTYDEAGTGNGRTKNRWYGAYRNSHWYSSFGTSLNNANGNRLRCEVDEFPLNSLRESGNFARQALRALDGNENGKQGLDWGYWLLATWAPCSVLMQAPPPVTWSIGDPTNPLDARVTAAPNRVIAKYGFDQSSGLDHCWATYTTPAGATSVVSDHGFRVHTDDPLFVNHHWPSQRWSSDPAQQAPNARPTNVASANYVKRDGDATYGTEYHALLTKTNGHTTSTQLAYLATINYPKHPPHSTPSRRSFQVPAIARKAPQPHPTALGGLKGAIAQWKEAELD